MLAVLKGVHYFRSYLHGQKFFLFPDHSALKESLKMKEPNGHFTTADFLQFGPFPGRNSDIVRIMIHAKEELSLTNHPNVISLESEHPIPRHQDYSYDFRRFSGPTEIASAHRQDDGERLPTSAKGISREFPTRCNKRDPDHLVRC